MKGTELRFVCPETSLQQQCSGFCFSAETKPFYAQKPQEEPKAVPYSFVIDLLIIFCQFLNYSSN